MQIDNKYFNLWKNALKDKGILLDEANSLLLENIFKIRVIDKDEFFIKEGDNSTEIGFVLEGVFRSFYIDKNGKDITKYFYAEGSMLFSYLSYLINESSEYDIQSIEESTILVIKVSELEKMMEGNYQLLLLYKKLLDEALVMKEEHAKSFKLMDSKERYEEFHKKYSFIEQRVKQHQLASYLGVTPVTLSRIRKKLRIIK